MDNKKEDNGVGKLLASDGRLATYEEINNEILDYGVFNIEEVKSTSLVTDSISLTNNYYISGSASNLTDFLKASEMLNIQNIFNSSKLKFYWGDSNHKDGDKDAKYNRYDVVYDETGLNFIVKLKCYNLIIDIPNYSIIEGRSPILIIDRYRKRARKGFKKENGDLTDIVRYRKSGFKHYKCNTIGNDSDFITEIPIDKKTMVLGLDNFNPDKLFAIGMFSQNGEYYPWFRTKGSGKKIGDNGVDPNNVPISKSGNVCSSKLRFRIGWKYNGKIFKTSDSGQILVSINREVGTDNGEKFILTYKMI